MIKNFFLITLLVLTGVQSSVAAPWANFLKNAASKITSRNGFQSASNQLQKAKIFMQKRLAKNFMTISFQNTAGKVIKHLNNSAKKYPRVFKLGEMWSILAGALMPVKLGDKTFFSGIDPLSIYAHGDKGINFYCNKSFTGDYKSSHFAASASASNKIVHINSSAMEKALIDASHSNHACARAIIGHELGHIINNDRTIKTTMPATLMLGAGLSIPFLFTKNISFLKRWSNSGMLLGLLPWHLINIANKRKLEMKADFHLINCAQDFRELRQIASWFDSLNDPMPKNRIDYCLSTHPLPSERAAYFEKAADELEKRIGER
jgi:hypothetical protein